MIELLWIPVVSAVDRIRGGLLGSPYHTISEWTMGLICSLAAGVFDPVLGILAAILFGIGEMTGWGHPMGQVSKYGIHAHKYPYLGSSPEWWQVKLGISDRPLLSLVVRGAIWTIPVVPLGVMPFFMDFGDYRYLIWLPAMMFAFPVSVLIEHYFFRNLVKKGINVLEYARGAIFGAILVACNLLIFK